MESEKFIEDVGAVSTNMSSLSRKIAEWLTIDLEIKIFGITVLSYHYPPINERKQK